MLANVIDYRTNKHNVECDAIFEDSAHDNRVEGATQFPVDPVVHYHEILRTTVKDALTWVTSKYGNQTMYLYDPGSQNQRKLLPATS